MSVLGGAFEGILERVFEGVKVWREYGLVHKGERIRGGVIQGVFAGVFEERRESVKDALRACIRGCVLESI